MGDREPVGAGWEIVHLTLNWYGSLRKGNEKTDIKKFMMGQGAAWRFLYSLGSS